jgi:hypothetical protein
MAQCGAEMLAETARFFYDLGFFSQEKDGRFVINCVTGPDEYNVLVNNNTYTNRIAAETFINAAKFMRLLEEKRPEDYQRLCERIGYEEQEAADWEKAAELMYYPPKKDGICPQDDDFLNRKPWPLETIPAEKRPLLMHYHGLTIYRHMICKQADLILAMVQFGDSYTEEEKKTSQMYKMEIQICKKRNSREYYEKARDKYVKDLKTLQNPKATRKQILRIFKRHDFSFDLNKDATDGSYSLSQFEWGDNYRVSGNPYPCATHHNAEEAIEWLENYDNGHNIYCNFKEGMCQEVRDIVIDFFNKYPNGTIHYG